MDVTTLPLPTGASTLVEQQTQTTALQLIDNLPLAQASATAGQSGVLTQAAVTTSQPAYTTAQTDPLSLTTEGELRVEVRYPTSWTVVHTPGAATQATATRATAGAGIRNVARGLSISLASAAVPTVGAVTFNLRDGGTGAGTILWSIKLSLQATSGISANHSIGDIWIEGTANTAMTLETAAATAANVQGSVSLIGTTTTG